MGAEEGGSVSQSKGCDQWAVGLEAPGGGRELPHWTDPPFCDEFYPVLFCMLTFPVMCFFSLHLFTKVGLCCSECLSPSPQPQTEFLPRNGILDSLRAFLWLHGIQGGAV